MTTLLLTHPASLDHLTPPGHPERPDRLRAVTEVLAEDRFDPLVRGEAPEGRLDFGRALSQRALCRRAPAYSRRSSGLIFHRRRHLDVARHLGGGDARRRRRDRRDRRGYARASTAMPSSRCALPAIMPRPRRADGLLLFRPCRDRRASCPAQIRHRPRRRRRLRRPSRQRHPGHLLGRSDRDVLLDPPDAAVSRHRRARRARRARHHRQCAAGPGRWRGRNSAPRSTM